MPAMMGSSLPPVGRKLVRRFLERKDLAPKDRTIECFDAAGVPPDIERLAGAVDGRLSQPAEADGIG
jgi:hypothetical protein